MTSSTIGLLGGTFDPVHYGHLRLADYLYHHCQWHEVRFIPTPGSPLRTKPNASFQDRCAMLTLATHSFPHFGVDPIENDLPQPAYTINTLRALRAQYTKETPLAFIIGQDAWNTLDQWHEWEKLHHYAHLVVVNRPGVPNQPNQLVQDTLAPFEAKNPQTLNQTPAGCVLHVKCPENAISATAIRHAVLTQNNDFLQQVIPKNLIEYIQKNRLYLNCI